MSRVKLNLHFFDFFISAKSTPQKLCLIAQKGYKYLNLSPLIRIIFRWPLPHRNPLLYGITSVLSQSFTPNHPTVFCAER